MAAYAPANAATGQYGTISASLGGALSHGTSGRSSVRPHGPTAPTEPSASVPVPLGAGAGAGSGMNGNGAVMAALLFGVVVVVVGVVGAVGGAGAITIGGGAKNNDDFTRVNPSQLHSRLPKVCTDACVAPAGTR